jgi:hypothetical protein
LSGICFWFLSFAEKSLELLLELGGDALHRIDLQETLVVSVLGKPGNLMRDKFTVDPVEIVTMRFNDFYLRNIEEMDGHRVLWEGEVVVEVKRIPRATIREPANVKVTQSPVDERLGVRNDFSVKEPFRRVRGDDDGAVDPDE